MRCIGLEELLKCVCRRVLGSSLRKDLDWNVRIETCYLGKDFRCVEVSIHQVYPLLSKNLPFEAEHRIKSRSFWNSMNVDGNSYPNSHVYKVGDVISQRIKAT